MQQITSTFLRGLGVVLPVALTAWFLIWLIMSTEELLRPMFTFFLPEEYYLPGLGLALGIVIIYAAGVLVQVFIIKKVWDAIEQLLERIPLVKTVYSAINDFFEFFSRDRAEDAAAVVSVDLGFGGVLIGFVTDENPTIAGLPEGRDERVAVYLPMSYMIGGYTILVERQHITELEIGVEEAMRMVLTAGIGSGD